MSLDRRTIVSGEKSEMYPVVNVVMRVLESHSSAAWTPFVALDAIPLVPSTSENRSSVNRYRHAMLAIVDREIKNGLRGHETSRSSIIDRLIIPEPMAR